MQQKSGNRSGTINRNQRTLLYNNNSYQHYRKEIAKERKKNQKVLDQKKQTALLRNLPQKKKIQRNG